MDLWGVYLFHLVFIALHEVLSTGRDCLVAGDSCSSDETCSPRLRTLRQCVAGDGSMKLGPGARSHCANAVSALISSPLHGCQCKRGMKKEKNCLSIYWSLHQSVIHGLNLVESYPYETAERDYNSVRLASITADSEANVATVNRCLDAAKACNVDDLCQKLRTEYVSACIKPLAKSGLCNKAKCNKALRRFFDRVPPAYTHELLFCPCTDMACAERRRQTIVPGCSYEGSDKPSCLIQMSMCKGDYVCRSRLAQFQYDCQPAESSANSCKQGNYGACLLAYTGLIGNALLAFGSGTDVMPTSSKSGHLSPATGRESHAINPLPATVETTRNIPESIIPTQASGNDRLWRDSTLPSDGLPNSAPALGLLPPTSFTGLLVLPLLLYSH
ncbi:GDNF family receptor alpha-4-like isoform 2-T2 [Salvelinus alpinus]